MNRRCIALPIVVLAGLLIITGCAENTGDTPPSIGPAADTWTVTQVGGEDFMKETTGIRITFPKAMELTENGENLNNIIDVMGAAERDGMLRKEGDGKSWIIPVAVKGAGGATVIVDENDRGIEVASKPVVVFRKNEFAPIVWTVKANGDEENSTNKLTFTFTGDIAGQFFLTSGVITITPDPDVDMKQRGNALVGAVTRLPGNGYVFEVNVNTSTTGWVLITVEMDGVDTFPRRLQVILGSNDMFKPPVNFPEDPKERISMEEAENGGENMPFSWTVLTIDDPDEDLGFGNIVGEDLRKIRDAWDRDTHFYDDDPDPLVKIGYGSFLRVYADISDVIPSENGHAKLAVGNLKLNLTGMEASLAMQNYTIQPMEGTPVGPGIVTMDVPLRFIIPDYCPDTDDYLFVNAWEGVIVHAVVLYEVETPVKLLRPARWKRDITMTGTVDRIGGAGAFLTYFDEEMSWAAPENAWIEFYVKGAGAGNWGSTGYNWTVGRPGCIALPNNRITTDPDWGRYNKVDMADIKASRDEGNLDRNTINPYAGSAFEKIWLCWE